MLLIALFVLAATGIIAYRQIQRLIEANAWVVHTYQVIKKTDQILLSLTDVESKILYYSISNNKLTIQDIPNILEVVNKDFISIQLLTRDNPNQQRNLVKLQFLIKDKSELIHQAINNSSGSDTKTSIALMTSQKNINLNQQISQLIDTIVDAELILLENRTVYSRLNSEKSNVAIIITGILSELLFLLSIILLNYYLNKKDKIELKQIETERELIKTNYKLQENEERYNLAIKGSKTGLWDWIVGTDQVFYSSDFKNLLGYEENDFPHLFSSFENILHPDDHDRVLSLVAAHLKDDVPYIIEYRLKRKSGEYHWYQAIGQAMRNEDGLAVRMSGTLLDINERKLVEKMKNEFISVVSHELRTPLTSIHGAIALLASGEITALSSDASQLLDIAKTNCERLIRLVNDMLDIEKIESGNTKLSLVKCELNKIIEEAADANQAYGSQFSVKIKVINSRSPICVNIDHDKLLQVLANLISNAVKFSPAHDEVKIMIEEQNNNMVRVSITDKGNGIPVEFQKSIFNKFSQADSSSSRKQAGTGLGLNISKSIIEKMNGSLNFITEINKGTTFYFDLPVGEKIKKNEIQQHLGKSKALILYVEDDTDLAKIISTVLRNDGNLVSVTTLKDARKELKAHSYDLVILDILLPDGSGVELLSSIGKRNIPVIIFTAYEIPNEYLHYTNQVLIKSKTSNQELLNAVREAIA